MTTTKTRAKTRTANTASARRPLASTEEVAAYLGITVGALIQLRYLGKAPKAAKVGTRLRWNWGDVDAWLAKNAS